MYGWTCGLQENLKGAEARLREFSRQSGYAIAVLQVSLPVVPDQSLSCPA